MPVRREGCLTQRARVELGRVGRAILQTGQVADRDLPFAKRRVIPSVDAGSAVRRSAACVFSLRSRLVESGCPCDAPPHRTAPCRASEFASQTPFRGSRTKPKKIAARATSLRTAGSESWRSMPSRDGHLIRAALVGIQPEVCRSVTTAERRRAAINRGRWRDRSRLLPGRRPSRGRQALPSRWWSRSHAIAGDDLPRIVGRSRCDFASALRHGVRSAARAGAPRRRVCGRRKSDPTGATPPGQAAPWSVWESARNACTGPIGPPIPGQLDRRFRSNWTADSGAIGPLIPVELDRAHL